MNPDATQETAGRRKFREGTEDSEARRTVSRFLVPALAGRAAVIPLGPPLLAGSSDRPGSQAERATPSSPIWSCSAWGLPCHSGCPERGALLPHLFTLARRVAAAGGMFSVALSVKRALSAPPRPLAGTLPCGDRTLPRTPAVSPLGDAPGPRLPVRRTSVSYCFIRPPFPPGFARSPGPPGLHPRFWLQGTCRKAARLGLPSKEKCPDRTQRRRPAPAPSRARACAARP
jgi:hypothetical protein